MYTFGQLYGLMQTFIDKAGSPYFPESQFDQIANSLYNDFVENELGKLEEDEEYTSRVEYLYEVVQKVNTQSIAEVADCPNFRKRIRFNMRYRYECNGVVSFPYSPIIKARNNEIDEMQRDPFNKGTDQEPSFVVTRSNGVVTWQVFSSTLPTELNVTYVRNPQKIDAANNPDVVFETPDYIAEEIVRFIADEMDNITENFNRSMMKQKFLSRFITVPSQPA